MTDQSKTTSRAGTISAGPFQLSALMTAATPIVRWRVARLHDVTASVPPASGIAAAPKGASIIAITSARTGRG